MVSADVESRYKSKDELEREEHIRYRKHQELTFLRRQAKIEAEGFKCPYEGCTERFPTKYELGLHLQVHREECSKQMKCWKSDCGKKFTNKKAFLNHIQMHKQEVLDKAKKDIRSVLIINKHGIIADEFEREYKSLVGQKLPLDLMGVTNLDELAALIPEVMKVVQMSNGTTLIQGIPDENTAALANEIHLQRYNRDGFNYKTGEALKGRNADDFTALNSNRELIRKSPEFLKKQIRTLIEYKEIDEQGLTFPEFLVVYEMEHGFDSRDIEKMIEELGYFGMEDLFLNGGLLDEVDLRLEDFDWKIYPKGINSLESNQSDESSFTEEWNTVKRRIQSILNYHPFGMSFNSFCRELGTIKLSKIRCKDVLDVCLMLPDVCQIDTHIDKTILPAKFDVQRLWLGNKKPSFPLYKLGEVKNRVKELFKFVSGEVIVRKFVESYENYYGCLNLVELGCDNFLQLLKLMPDVARIRKDKNYSYYISLGDGDVPPTPVSEERGQMDKNAKIPREIIRNLHKVLSSCPNGIPYTYLYSKYLEVNGQSLKLDSYGFSTLSSFLRKISGNNGLSFDGRNLFALSKLLTLPEVDVGNLSSGWVKVVQVHDVGKFKIVLNSDEAQFWTLELKMEEYYASKRLGRFVREEECFVGQFVAVIFEDARFYRAEVIDKLEDDIVKVILVDVGVTVLVKHQCLFWLQHEFTLLPAQTIDIKFSSEYSSVSEILELLNANQNYAWLEVSSLEIQLMPGKLSQTSRLSQRNIPSSQVFKRLMLNRIAAASDKK